MKTNKELQNKMTVRDQIIELCDKLNIVIQESIQQAVKNVESEISDTFIKLGEIYGCLSARCQDDDAFKLVGFPKEEKAQAELIILKGGEK